jgi:hypothetical protein
MPHRVALDIHVPFWMFSDPQVLLPFVRALWEELIRQAGMEPAEDADWSYQPHPSDPEAVIASGNVQVVFEEPEPVPHSEPVLAPSTEDAINTSFAQWLLDSIESAPMAGTISPFHIEPIYSPPEAYSIPAFETDAFSYQINQLFGLQDASLTFTSTFDGMYARPQPHHDECECEQCNADDDAFDNDFYSWEDLDAARWPGREIK